MNHMLKVDSLTKAYSDFQLNSVTFELPMGYIMGLIGPNGSGKTTTIKAILNMIKRDSGSITVLKKDNIRDELDIKKNIGVVLDSSYFVDDWEMEDIDKVYSLFYPTWNSEKFWSLLAKFKIAKGKRVKELSKGMQMKLMLACSFSYNAKLLILDEPTSGLDPISRDELLSILADYIEDGQHSVLFSTHITSDLEKIADYITYIHLGKMIYTGSKEDFIDGYRIVAGDKKALTPELKNKLIGLRTYPTGFEALIQKNNLSYASGLETISATIDDIVVFINRDTEQNKKEEK